MQQAGQAYSNYRQFGRDNSANQLSNQSSLYQGLMNRMAAAGDGAYSPNTAQMGNNPMSLAQTTVGSTHGSNAAGNGVDFYGNGTDANGNVAPGAYGLIGNMGLQSQGKWATPGGEAPATMDANGNPLPPGGQLNNINTQNGAPAPPPQSPPGQFSFAPRRP